MEPFSAFMARALYDPQRGYYTRNVKTVGARGDFSTSATLSLLLGRAIAIWLAEESRVQPQVKHIIEIGPGNGALHEAVQRTLGWWRRRGFQFHLVETSPVLRTQQQQRLGSKARWHEDLAAALNAADGEAFIFHNEVLDAFPATLIQWLEGEWHEVYVGRDENGRWRELPGPVPLLDAADFSALNDWQPPHGQRCELHPAVRDWMAQWAPHWQAGAMLTIDYGDAFPALYHRRPAGTLRAYLLQQRLQGDAVYGNPGRQDITADINFTDYRSWARALGWDEVAYGTQAEFIAPRVGSLDSAADHFLMHPDGAGQALKHVIHRRLRK